jgi:hypothetical protein
LQARALARTIGKQPIGAKMDIGHEPCVKLGEINQIERPNTVAGLQG